jgi:hypothetical protein
MKSGCLARLVKNVQKNFQMSGLVRIPVATGHANLNCQNGPTHAGFYVIIVRMIFLGQAIYPQSLAHPRDDASIGTGHGAAKILQLHVGSDRRDEQSERGQRVGEEEVESKDGDDGTFWQKKKGMVKGRKEEDGTTTRTTRSKEM